MTGGPGWVRAVAVDFDGTLTAGGRPRDDVLAALARTRDDGVVVVLVTGRILRELAAVWGDADRHVDMVCAEDGAVLHGPGWTRHLATPVGAGLNAALAEAGVPFRRGEVIVATVTSHAAKVDAALARTGVDGVPVRNRGELMVVPAGVDKGHGLRAALAVLGVSHHHAVAVGDAENDLPMLGAVEVGAAPANAVPAVRRAADLPLRGGAGDAVAELLDRAVLTAAGDLRPARGELPVGTAADGAVVAVPGSRATVLVSGPSGAGKSHVAALLAEELVHAGDTLLVIDPEGDYAALGALPGVRLLDGRAPSPGDAAAAFRAGAAGVVADLSLLPPDGRRAAASAVIAEVAASRRPGGIPHWLLLDEAHAFCDLDDGPGIPCGAADALLLVTYMPQRLPRAVRDRLDAEILLPGAFGAGAGTPVPAHRLAALVRAGRGHALVLRGGEARIAAVPPPRLPHVRHRHKYADAHLPEAHHFVFRSPDGAPTGAVATNIAAFHDLLRDAPPEVVAHHCAWGDASRWVREVMGDGILAARLAEAEGRMAATGTEATRAAMVAAIARRYGPRPPALHSGPPAR